jgi:hypothetical protein
MFLTSMYPLCYHRDDMADEYTHTRITKSYLDKLRTLATRHKRSCMKQLEALIDEAYKADYNPLREHQRQAALARKSKMSPEEWSAMSRKGALARNSKKSRI